METEHHEENEFDGQYIVTVSTVDGVTMQYERCEKAYYDEVLELFVVEIDSFTQYFPRESVCSFAMKKIETGDENVVRLVRQMVEEVSEDEDDH